MCSIFCGSCPSVPACPTINCGDKTSDPIRVNQVVHIPSPQNSEALVITLGVFALLGFISFLIIFVYNRRRGRNGAPNPEVHDIQPVPSLQYRLSPRRVTAIEELELELDDQSLPITPGTSRTRRAIGYMPSRNTCRAVVLRTPN